MNYSKKTKDEVAAELDLALKRTKYAVQVFDVAYGCFTIEIFTKHGLAERLPSFQPNFEERLNRILELYSSPQ